MNKRKGIVVITSCLLVGLSACSLKELEKIKTIGENMEPTIDKNTTFFVTKNPEAIKRLNRFDIVVYSYPQSKRPNVGRIIGLPGEKITYQGDKLYINNKEVAEPHLKKAKENIIDDYPLTFDFTLEKLLEKDVIPDNEYFIMGDNRRKSKDSRMIGTIKQDQIIGVKNE